MRGDWLMKHIEIYTDGACSGNPGKGGWAAILMYNGVEKILSGGEENTTNNRMELTAIIEGIRAIKYPCEVTVYSDSAYSVEPFIQNWIETWKKNNWKKRLNVDLWLELLSVMEGHKVNFIKVKGHSDNVNNNRCDELARKEIEKLK